MSAQDPRPPNPGGEARGTPDDIVVERLRAANEQLVISSVRAQEHADEANASRANAEDANRLKDEFLAIVSHELRTPLNTVLTWARLLAGGQLDAASTATAIGSIERNANALAVIIDDLLDVSRIARGKIAFDPKPIDPVAVIEAALDETRLAAEAKGVAVAFGEEAHGTLVTGDAHRLQQVVVNLVSNAIKFTPTGGRVDIRISSSGSDAEIRVADTGQGIAAEFLPHLFDRFTQADTSPARRHGGLGLGLAIVKAIVGLHGGTVHADSPGPGKGAVFTVRIPLLASGAPAEALPHRETPAAGPRLGGLSVLLAEDDADSREALVAILQLAGAKVEAVGSVRRALSVFNDVQPDVLISDIGMAGEDGYALIREVRTRGAERGGNTPAIAVTGYVSLAEHRETLAAGYDMHLKKPVEPSELVAAVATLAARAA
jgi:signal transduction histidine kinase